MPNNLADAVSPYLRSHADNPVDWQPWGSAAFAAAAARDVPVLISIGYSTCHWCHVMARETFSDPELAAYLNANFVSIKVDREEHPDVDSSYLAAAGAFTEQLGWPLNVFATPTGRAFFAGTYFPPTPVQGLPSFREVLGAIRDAWVGHRSEVEETARQVADLVTGGPERQLVEGGAVTLPEVTSESADGPWPAFDDLVGQLEHYEDHEHGGFGGAPKFPVAPVLGFLLERGEAGDHTAGELARRTLAAMASSDLRDPIEGGFFRYSTKADWTDPHYERMLYDNALLLELYAQSKMPEVAAGIGSFLLQVLRLPSGGFASAQDSESTVDGARVEGGYYALDAAGRANQAPPALDEKVLTGWNGLAIGALASAGSRLGHNEPHPEWIEAAVAAHEVGGGDDDGPLVRARLGDRTSSALPTLEDFGMLADGLTKLAIATGEPRFAIRARQLVDATLTSEGVVPFRVPGDPTLTEHRLALDIDPSEGAYPSGLSSLASSALSLHSLGAGARYRAAASRAMRIVAPLAVERPMSFGAALGVMSRLAAPEQQLLIVGEAGCELEQVARDWSGGLGISVTDEQAKSFAAAGFDLFESRTMQGGAATAYLCENFVCRLPVTDAAALSKLLGS
jgi:uncharacterized protein YyaL (SSP411 family)